MGISHSQVTLIYIIKVSILFIIIRYTVGWFYKIDFRLV